MDDEGDDDPVPLPNVNAAILKKVTKLTPLLVLRLHLLHLEVQPKSIFIYFIYFNFLTQVNRNRSVAHGLTHFN